MQQYKEDEFEKWCEDHMIEDNFGLWDFIKNQEVELNINSDEHGDKSILTVKVKLGEV